MGFFKRNLIVYDLVGYKYIFMSYVFLWKVIDSVEWLRCMEDLRFVKYMGWYVCMCLKRWYMIMGKEFLYLFRRILYNEVEDYYYINMISWIKLYIYIMVL